MIRAINVTTSRVISTINAPTPITENNPVAPPIKTPTAKANKNANIQITIAKQQ